MYVLINKKYRKPSTLIFEKIKAEWKSIKIKKIKVCGDAAEEYSDYSPYKWSNSDYQFYLNLDFSKKKFNTPNEIFGLKDLTSFKIRKKELVILVGNQGSGKSTVANYFKNNGYFVISGDDGLTISKQKKLLHQYISENKSVIIDNTNPSKKKREVFLEIAKENNYKTRIIWCIQDGRSFNILRENPIPEIAYNIYSKNFEEPSLDEVNEIELFY